MKQSYTTKELINEWPYPIKRTRLIELIRNGVEFRNGTLSSGKNYLIAYKLGDGKRSPWVIDGVEVEAFVERARNRKM